MAGLPWLATQALRALGLETMDWRSAATCWFAFNVIAARVYAYVVSIRDDYRIYKRGLVWREIVRHAQDHPGTVKLNPDCLPSGGRPTPLAGRSEAPAGA